MIKAFVLAVFTLLCVQSFGQEKSANQKKFAEITFDKKTHNFGKIYEDKVAKYDFKFYNNGNRPLIIKNATASCNCTVPDWSKEPIMPGDSGIISTSFNPKGYTGHTFRKTITVFTNAKDGDKRNQLYFLQITGRVLPKQ